MTTTTSPRKRRAKSKKASTPSSSTPSTTTDSTTTASTTTTSTPSSFTPTTSTTSSSTSTASATTRTRGKSNAQVNISSKNNFYGKDGTIWKSESNWKSSDYAQFSPTLDFSPKLTPESANLRTLEDFFHHLIDSFIVDKIVEYTNKRLFDDEKPITHDEMIGFFGLMLLLGVTKKSDIEISEIYNPASPHHSDWATACMPRDRFKLICSIITFDDVETRPERAKLNPKFHKMAEIFTQFQSNIQKYFEPGDKFTIDEQLYAYRGRCAFKQYIPSKPNKYGFKIWALVCAITGYLIYCTIYLGKFKNKE